MSTSKPPQPPHQPAPSSYTRFIPREELGNFAAWSPTAFEQGPGGQSPADTGLRKPTLAERAAQEVVNRQANAQQKAELGKALREAAASVMGKGAAPAAAQPTARPAARPAAPAATVQPASARAQPKRPIIGGVPGEQVAVAEEPAPQPEPPPVPAGPSVEEQLREARQSSYQEGYRNGLAALESYKATQSAQMAARSQASSLTAASTCRQEMMPSPVVCLSRQMICPEFSPPRIHPRRCINSMT